MSGDRNYWEVKFVDAYVMKSKRSRYKKLLGNPTKRGKILDRINHNADLDYEKAIRLSGAQAFSSQLIRKLSAFEIDAQCWLISDDPELDGKLLQMREASELTAGADWGTIMICPPKPIAVYRAEAPETSLYLFS